LADQPGKLVIHGPQAAWEASGLTHSLQAAMQPGAELTYLRSDYGDLASVVRLAEDIRSSTGRIDVLINNAARPGAPARTLSSDGNEITLQTNYLAPVAWLARHLLRPSVEVVSMHPGVIATTLLHEMFGAGGDRPEHAASNLMQVVSNSGQRRPIPSPWTQSPKIGSTSSPRLHWRLSCRESDKSGSSSPTYPTKELHVAWVATGPRISASRCYSASGCGTAGRVLGRSRYPRNLKPTLFTLLHLGGLINRPVQIVGG
jgi:hypothetical protein